MIFASASFTVYNLGPLRGSLPASWAALAEEAEFVNVKLNYMGDVNTVQDGCT